MSAVSCGELLLAWRDRADRVSAWQVPCVRERDIGGGVRGLRRWPHVRCRLDVGETARVRCGQLRGVGEYRLHALWGWNAPARCSEEHLLRLLNGPCVSVRLDRAVSLRCGHVCDCKKRQLWPVRGGVVPGRRGAGRVQGLSPRQLLSAGVERADHVSARAVPHLSGRGVRGGVSGVRQGPRVFLRLDISDAGAVRSWELRGDWQRVLRPVRGGDLSDFQWAERLPALCEGLRLCCRLRQHDRVQPR